MDAFDGLMDGKKIVFIIIKLFLWRVPCFSCLYLHTHTVTIVKALFYVFTSALKLFEIIFFFFLEKKNKRNV